MEKKRVETISGRVDAAVSSPGRTVVACYHLAINCSSVRSCMEETSGKTPSIRITYVVSLIGQKYIPWSNFV